MCVCVCVCACVCVCVCVHLSNYTVLLAHLPNCAPPLSEKYDAAIADYRKAMALAPEHKNARLYLETTLIRKAKALRAHDKV